MEETAVAAMPPALRAAVQVPAKDRGPPPWLARMAATARPAASASPLDSANALMVPLGSSPLFLGDLYTHAPLSGSDDEEGEDSDAESEDGAVSRGRNATQRSGTANATAAGSDRSEALSASGGRSVHSSSTDGWSSTAMNHTFTETKNHTRDCSSPGVGVTFAVDRKEHGSAHAQRTRNSNRRGNRHSRLGGAESSSGGGWGARAASAVRPSGGSRAAPLDPPSGWAAAAPDADEATRLRYFLSFAQPTAASAAAAATAAATAKAALHWRAAAAAHAAQSSSHSSAPVGMGGGPDATGAVACPFCFLGLEDPQPLDG
jgi:hypothetical protein